MRSRLLGSCLLGLVSLTSACDGTGVTGAQSGRIARVGGTPSTANALVGNWRRTVFFLDEFGYARSSETTFRFAGDGSVVRVQVARNLTLGFVDALVSAGQWQVIGTRAVIDFVTPSAFRLDLEARIVGDQLELGGQTYLRVVQ